MPKFTMEMVLEYAKVFKHNADYGNSDGNRTQAEIAAKGGQTSVNAYFTSEADKQKLIDAGLNLKPLGNDRILRGNEEFGIGEYIKLKRDVESNVSSGVSDNGKEWSVERGGLPDVIDFRDPENKCLWDVDESGELGNGTKAIVKFDMYSRGSGLRLEKLAVTELVEWVPQAQDEYKDVWDV